VSAPRPVHPAVDLEADLDALIEERDFLLRSLKDLEAEHEAGDLDEVDYRGLKDDYTARAADVLRAIKDHQSPRRGATAPEPSEDRGLADVGRSRRRWRSAAVTAGVLIFGLLAGWLVTVTSGSRLPGQTVTGNSSLNSSTTTVPPGNSVPQLLNRAGQLVTQQKVTDALKLYDQILKDNPRQPEALANSGWLIAQAGLAFKPPNGALVDTGLTRIVAAEQAAPSYPDPHFFRGFLLLRAKNDGPGAVTELRMYLGMVDPSSPAYSAVTQLLSDAMAMSGGPKPSP
jgi:hypothetical protein